MFDDIAKEIALRQYALPHETSVEEIFERAATVVNSAPRIAEDKGWLSGEIKQAMLDKRFCPGGRILAGAGTTHGNLLNCFVQDGHNGDEGITDKTRYALNLAKKLALVTKVGGGNGVNLDVFPGKHSPGLQYTRLPIFLVTEDPDVKAGRFLDLVTGERKTYGYKALRVLDPGDVINVESPDDVVEIKVPDDTAGIWDAAAQMVLEHQRGKVVIIDVSNLRPEGSTVRGSGGTSSGPASFAVEIFDNFARWAKLGGGDYAGPVATLRYVLAPTLRVIRQGGVRRGAGMATLSAEHPDIEDFLTSKDLRREQREGDISTFNISVLIPDRFMRAVGRDETSKESVLLDKIAQHAWDTGEPGLLYVDTINKNNLLYERDGPILATNPCLTGETEILTVDGPRRFDELARTEADVDVWAIDIETNEPVIATMRRPHMTRTDAEILRVEFDSGLVVHATPDHNFYTLQRNKVQAKDLRPGQSVSAFNIHQHRDGHLRIVRNQKETDTVKQWFVHRLIYDHYNGIPEGYLVHHVDKDPTNNSLDNLAAMTPVEHNQHHYPERAANGFNGMSPNHKVVSVTPAGTADVYNGMVEGHHNYIVVDPTPMGTAFLSGIVSANCGEIGLYPGEPCDLGAVNVSAYFNMGDEVGSREWHLALDRILNDSFLYAEYLDLILDVEKPPLPEIGEAIESKRRIGLGMMGLGDALIKLGVRYGSSDATEVAYELAKRIRQGAMEYTYDAPPTPSLPGGRRNVALVTVAPTGTTAMVMGTTSGIEPLFAPFIYRRVGTEYKQILHPLFKEMMEQRKPSPYFCTWKEVQDGMYVPDQWDWSKVTSAIVENHGSVKGIVGIPKDVQYVFACAHDVSPAEHVRMQAAVQEAFDYDGVDDQPTYAGNSISKTINMPQGSTWQEVRDVYRMGWVLQLKGITVYVDGSRDLQVLNTSMEDDGSTAKSQAQDEQLQEIIAASCSLDGTCDI